MLVPDHVLERRALPDVPPPQGLQVLERRAEEPRAIAVGGGGGGGSSGRVLGGGDGVGEEPAEVAVEVRRGGRDERGRAAAERGEGGGRDAVGRWAEEERGGVRGRRGSRGGVGAGSRRRERGGRGGGESFREEETMEVEVGPAGPRAEEGGGGRGAGGEGEHGHGGRNGSGARAGLRVRTGTDGDGLVGPKRKPFGPLMLSWAGPSGWRIGDDETGPTRRRLLRPNELQQKHAAAAASAVCPSEYDAEQ